MPVVVAAGGVVYRTVSRHIVEYALVHRPAYDDWSLPKGKLQPGETEEEAAVREVEEETGIIGQVVAPLGTIDFWFVAEDRRVHKTVHHFLLRALGGELSDSDVEVSEVAWVPLDELESRLAYADERRLIRRATELMEETA
jgi:8-oxo-dGTP pyrophosphatase MutT (NUDIX family)